jgi:2-polyprenyl-6-methoxyphenol hydroxylase-like FAD-dependent oxidoreductase
VYTVTRTIIAGGGIVGLTAGRALLRAGMEVIVAEKADAIRAAGATLGLWANAVRVFDDLAVDVRSVGREAEMYFHGTSGQLLRTPEFGEEDHRYLLAHRASLNNLLAESVGYDNIRLEAAVAGFEEDQDRFAAHPKRAQRARRPSSFSILRRSRLVGRPAPRSRAATGTASWRGGGGGLLSM